MPFRRAYRVQQTLWRTVAILRRRLGQPDTGGIRFSAPRLSHRPAGRGFGRIALVERRTGPQRPFAAPASRSSPGLLGAGGGDCRGRGIADIIPRRGYSREKNPAVPRKPPGTAAHRAAETAADTFPQNGARLLDRDRIGRREKPAGAPHDGGGGVADLAFAAGANREFPATRSCAWNMADTWGGRKEAGAGGA